MDQGIVIEGVSFKGRCGVTPEERATPQPMLVDLEVAGPFTDAIATDELTKTIDYAAIATRVVDIGTSRDSALIETLADRISQALLAEFPIVRLHIWLRKTAAPLPCTAQSVGVRSTYTRPSSSRHGDSAGFSVPARFLVDQYHRLPRGKILDLASGSGRHALWLANHGYQVHAIDRDQAALDNLQAEATRRRFTTLTTEALDLEANPTAPPSLGSERYAGIIVFYYLFRPLFPSLIRALTPGGVLMYETFLIDNHEQYQHPRRTEFCLQHNELLSLTHGLRVLHYSEGNQEESSDGPSTFTARLVAQKPFN